MERINGVSYRARKGNIRYITLSLSKPEQFEDAIKVAQTFYDSYWYIYHDQDDTAKHLHIVCYDKNGTTLKAHCERFSNELDIPSNMICKVLSSRAILRYLIHKDNPEKHQYLIDNIVTNNKAYLFSCFDETDKPASDTQYADFLKCRRGEITPTDFIKKYHYEFAKLNFYQKVMTFDKISKLL